MTTHEEIEQLLWDYVLGLLDPEEARAVEARITSEHDVARAYAEIRQEADLLEVAARIELPRITLQSPADVPVSPAASARVVSEDRSRRTVMMFLSSAALVLAGLVGYTWLTSETLRDKQALARAEREIAADNVRVVVSGPARVEPETTLYTVQLEDVLSTASEAEFEYALLDRQGKVLEQASRTADAQGNGTIEIDGAAVNDEAQLKVWSRASGEATAATLALSRAFTRYDTSLALDRDVYYAGDVVQFRTAVQQESLPTGEQPLEWRYHALNSYGESLGDAVVATTQNGVANGSIVVPADAPTGRYSLIAANPSGDAPTLFGNFYVVRSPGDAWQADVVLDHWELEPGKEVDGSVVAALPSGAPLSGARVKLSASVNGKTVRELSDEELQTGSDGRARFRFAVPPDATEGIAELNVTLQKEAESRTLQRSFQIAGNDAGPNDTINLPAQQAAKTRQLHTQFFPEGGTLLAGVPNEVYMWVESNGEQPQEVTGKVVDSKSQTVVDGIATMQGRAKFTLTPKMGETYSFLCSEASGTRGVSPGIEVPLPPADTKVTSKLSALKTVLQSDEALQVEVAATKTPAQLLIAANGGEQLWGQAFVDFGAAQKAEVVKQRVSVPLNPNASGVIDVTLYDVESNPPQPIAWRKIYRSPARKWNIEINPTSADSDDDYTRWSIQVRDENGRAAPAILGINVQQENDTDRLSLAAIRRESRVEENLAEREALLGQMPKNDLDLESRRELDLALGTAHSYGLRGFGAPSVNGAPATAGLADYDPAGGFNGPAPSIHSNFFSLPAMQLAVAGPQPPAIVDNLPVVEAAYRDSLAAWRSQQEQRWQAFALAIAVGGCMLICATLILAVLKLADRYRAWVPALATGAIAVLIGGAWLRTDLDRPIEIAARPVATYRGEQLIASGTMLGMGGGGLGAAGSGTKYLDALQEPALDRPVSPPEPAPIRAIIVPLAQDPQSDAGVMHFDDAQETDANRWFAKRYLAFGTGKDEAAVRFKEREELVRRATPWADQTAAAQPTASPVNPSPTVYWNPALETGADGKAEIQFAAPDRYRITIEASGSSRWGRLERIIERPAKSP